MVDPAWVRANAAAFDLMHLHFGLESFTPAHLRATVAALRDVGRPLVLTAHDLENPQLDDQAAHVALLDVVVPAADAVLTLTPGAAAELRERWGVAAEVVAHPHVVPLGTELPVGAPVPERVVGLHLRDLRPNVDGPGTTRALVAAVRELRAGGQDVRARVVLHDRVRDEGARDAVRAACTGADGVVLVEQPRPDDAALFADLADLDVSVLPYAHGTHSGWIELCWDLGVAVAAPAVGRFAEQHPDPAFLQPFARAEELTGALRRLLDGPAARPGSTARRALQERRRAARRVEAGQVAAAHLDVYRRVLASTG